MGEGEGYYGNGVVLDGGTDKEGQRGESNHPQRQHEQVDEKLASRELKTYTQQVQTTLCEKIGENAG